MMVEGLGLERQAGSALLHTNVIQAQTLAVTLAGYLTSSWHYQEVTSQSATICYGLSTVKAGPSRQLHEATHRESGRDYTPDVGRGGSSRAASNKKPGRIIETMQGKRLEYESEHFVRRTSSFLVSPSSACLTPTKILSHALLALWARIRMQQINI